MNYDESVRYLFSILTNINSGSFRLDRMRLLVDRLGRPERSFRVVHVAGTNGKGSTAAMIECGLRAAGFSTGLYTSPHLSRFNERYRVNGASLEDDAFAEVVEELRAANESLCAEGDGWGHPTMFETVTAGAFCAFRRAEVDWGVIEVGLGGRLDATNVVEPELAVVTPVALDHEGYLGNSLERIAGEKAGIFKPGAKVILGDQQPAARYALEARAVELGLKAVSARDVWRLESAKADACGRFTLRASHQDSRRLEARLGLAGEHQVDNALTAAAALDVLGTPLKFIQKGLSAVQWPGRLETVSGQPEVLLDAAHNPAGAATLATFLRRFHDGRRIHLIYGSSRDKAVEEAAAILFPQASRVTLTRSRVARGVRPETLLDLVDHHHNSIDLAPSTEQALSRAREAAGPDDLIVVAGSIFLVGEARDLLVAD
jgi:dihydrofolate synthase/folylpolyglutamate synthase